MEDRHPLVEGCLTKSQAAAVRSWMRTNRPVLQTGHRRDNSSSVVESRLPVGSALGSVTIWGAGSKDRHSASFAFRLRLARNPKWRMGTSRRAIHEGESDG